MRKIVPIFLAAFFTLSVAACGSGASRGAASQSGTSAVSLKVWGSQEDQALLNSLITGFKDAHPDKIYNVELGVVGEPDARTRYLEDPAAAADIFAFPDDQIRDFVAAGALYEITRNKDKIVSENIPAAVEAATLDGKLYAYPMTADNGYFLYYDSSVISPDDAKSIDGILAACNAAGKKFFFDLSNGWYIASFFLGGGCTIEIDENGKQQVDFNRERGVKIGEAIKAFAQNTAFTTGEDAYLQSEFGSQIAACVSGTWNADAFSAAAGANYAATKLPTFTMDGEQVQLGSFGGNKLLGISTQTKAPLDAMDLAEWLTNEQSQLARFEARALRPTNAAAEKDPRILENTAIAALAAQGPYAVSQKNVLGAFWGPSEAFGNSIETNDSTPIKTLLDTMVAQIRQ